MGFGVNLALIAIGAVLAFATHFTLSGVDVRAVGWILMAVGVIGMIVSFAFVRNRRTLVDAEADPLDPVYAVRDDVEEPAYAVVPERSSRWYRFRGRPTRAVPHLVEPDPRDQP